MVNWTAKNPLGIIALFISLIYGMSALLLGATIGSLSKPNQSVLVWFVVLFPVAVLAAFLWLVAKHHRKLYSPSDFRSDEGFLAEAADPLHLGERIAFEVDQISNEIGDLGGAEPTQESPPIPDLPVPVATESRAATVATAYLAESLAFKELEREFPGQIRQHVRINTPDGKRIEVDGLIETVDANYIVEVKFFTRSSHYSRRIRDAIDHISQVYINHSGLGPSNTRAIFVAIAGDGVPMSDVASQIELERGRSSLNISYRLYDASELFARYGFPVT